MTSPAPKSATPADIGRYHLVAELARGGMGNVYLAVSLGPGDFSKLVAMKELKPELCDDEAYVTMFLEEARLAARLIHPNVVQTNEVGSDAGRHFMVMEFLDGRSLHRIGKRLGAKLPVGAHLRVIAEVLLGLHYAHGLRGFDGEALDLVHRDVSPLNVFVTFNGQAKLLDFGIAKAIDSSFDTKVGVLKGRIAYMSPEQARGDKVDRRADIYSAGVMIWEAAAGRRLWSQMRESEVLRRVLREPAPSLRSVRPDAPEDLDRICARAMAYRPEDRYATVADLMSDLESHLSRRNDTMTLREIGTLVGEAFGEDRRRMDGLIDATIARVRRSSGITRAARPARAGDRVVACAQAEADVDAGAPMPTPSTSFGPHGGSLSQYAPATTASLGPALAKMTNATPVHRLAAMTLVGGALLLVTLFAGTAWRRARSPVPAVPAPLSALVHAPVLLPSSRETPPTAHIAVTVSPLTADVYVDDVPVTNPYVADPTPDPAPHRLRVEANGFQAASRTIDFSQDLDLKITLEPLRSALPARRAASPHSPAPSQPIAAASPAPSCQPPYTLDAATGAKHWRIECL